MQLTENFHLSEFLVSDTAARRGIDNTPPPAAVENLMKTALMLERIRAHLSKVAGRDVGILVSSGYRCLRLNRAIGSKDTSDHVLGLSADWAAPKFGTPYEVSSELAKHVDRLSIGQLIYEHTWIHTSVRVPAKVVNRILTVQGDDYVPGIKKGKS